MTNLFNTLKQLKQWRPGSLARGTMSMTLGLGVRALVQGAVFIIVSRTLGIENYGAFAAILALATILGSFSTLGTQFVMLRDVARTPSVFPIAWGRTLLATALSSPALLLAYLLAAYWILPDELSMPVISMIGIAEIVLVPFGLSTVTAYTARERMNRAALAAVLPVIPRFAAALILVLFASGLASHLLLPAWSGLYLVSAFLAAAFAQRLANSELGRGQLVRPGSLWPTVRQGLPFVTGSAALKTHNEIDKTLLARLSTLEATGAYSAAHRIVDLFAIPIVSLLTVSWPRFFRAGEKGSQDISRLALGLLPVPIAYAILIGFGMHFAADFLPLLLGPEYAMAVEVLKWLAWLPLISLPRLLLQMILNSSDKQHIALRVLLAGAAINVVLSLWLIVVYGWLGAVIATFIAEVLMAILMFAAQSRLRVSIHEENRQ